MRRATWKALGLLAAVTAAACTTEPKAEDRSLPLTAIDGAPLPFLLSATAFCDVFLDSAGLDLAAAGTFTLSFRVRDECIGALPVYSRQDFTGTWTYTDSLRLDVTAPPHAEQRFTGTADKDLVVLVDAVLAGTTPRAYRFGGAPPPPKTAASAGRAG